MNEFEIQGTHSEKVVTLTRDCQRKFSEEEVKNLAQGKCKIRIKLIGTPEEKREDLEYYDQISIDLGIPMLHQHDIVTLGEYR